MKFIFIYLCVGVIYLLDSDSITSLQSLELTSLQRRPKMLEMEAAEISIATIGSNFTEPLWPFFRKLEGGGHGHGN